jgi:hypothetical protein
VVVRPPSSICTSWLWRRSKAGRHRAANCDVWCGYSALDACAHLAWRPLFERPFLPCTTCMGARVVDPHIAKRRRQACRATDTTATGVMRWLAGMGGHGSEAGCMFNFNGVGARLQRCG